MWWETKKRQIGSNDWIRLHALISTGIKQKAKSVTLAAFFKETRQDKRFDCLALKNALLIIFAA